MTQQRELFDWTPTPEPDRESPLAEDGPLRRLIDDNFLQYASYVIRDRAIPDIDDGLKPVQRRILFSLHENDDGKFIKVANIVGYTMQYHPHGDASIADALVTLANRQYLIERQGNFGNIFTGDPAAASRYIECRLTELARHELFHDELTEFVPSYDSRRREPVALPCKLPLLLMLGAEGIAVGLATRILPHNFRELLEAQIAILEKKPFEIFPDFQQGGLMDIAEYDRGAGRVKLRACIEKRDDTTLVIRELPSGATTDSLIASIEDAAKKKKIAVKSIQDFTAEQVEIQIRTAPGVNLNKLIQALYAFTLCETSLASRPVVIHDGRPAEMNVEEILRYNTKRLVQLLKKELQFDKRKLQDDMHRKTLVQLFIEHRIYKQIEECATQDLVYSAVFDGVNAYRDQLTRDITRKDVEMLLQIPIRKISRFDIERSRKAIGDIVKELGQIEKKLKRIVPYTIQYLKRLLKQYGANFPRHTRITTFKEVEVRKLAENEYAIGYDREKGYLGHAVEGEPQLDCTRYDRLVLIWKDGRYKVINPPDKCFVDQDLIYCGLYKRDQIFTMVYTEYQITFMKRFTLGGTILNKDYRCTPTGDAEIRLFSADKPKEIYVKYRKEKRQRIHQQIFHADRIPVKGVKARGSQMTVKTIRSIGAVKPRGWDKAPTPRGAFIHD